MPNEKKYIDADKIIDWLWGEPKYYDVRNDRTNTIDYIKNQPTADVLPVVHAHWIEENDGTVQICSNCGGEHEWQEYRATYCEDCGAKMDGDCE